MSDYAERQARRQRIARREHAPLLPALRDLWVYPFMDRTRVPVMEFGPKRRGHPSAPSFRKWIANQLHPGRGVLALYSNFPVRLTGFESSVPGHVVVQRPDGTVAPVAVGDLVGGPVGFVADAPGQDATVSMEFHE